MGELSFKFGHEPVSATEQRVRVNQVFDSAADRYDLMNDVMSLGLHRIFKRMAIEYTGLRRGGAALDIAGGTGDLAILLARIAGREGMVVLLDLNEEMARRGRDRTIDAGCEFVKVMLADAEDIPVSDSSFDAVTMGFGLRNMADRDKALSEAHRVLKPGGRLVILEFSTPPNRWVAGAARSYRQTWPLAGRLVSGSHFSYTYLTRSIDTFPSQKVLCQMVEDAGFRQPACENLLWGALSLHIGTK